METKDTGRACRSGTMDLFMKDSGKAIKLVDSGGSFMRMETCMREVGSMTRRMAMESTRTQTEPIMWEIG